MKLTVWLRLVERTNLNGYKLGENVSDGWWVFFVVQEYASGENVHWLDGLLVRIIDVFHLESENMTMRVLYHNRRYVYVEIVEMN
jgi:hypothetical protein